MWACSWANGYVCFLDAGCKSDSPYTRKSNCSVTATFIWHWSVLSLHQIRQTRTPLLFSTSIFHFLVLSIDLLTVPSMTCHSSEHSHSFTEFPSLKIYENPNKRTTANPCLIKRRKIQKTLSSCCYIEHSPSSSFQRTITAFKKT